MLHVSPLGSCQAALLLPAAMLVNAMSCCCCHVWCNVHASLGMLLQHSYPNGQRTSLSATVHAEATLLQKAGVATV